MICCLASAACPLRDTAAPLAACGGREGIRAVYDAGIDLGHYGEVDQLAPAGAMAEFTAYVRRQSEEEAEAAFAPLRQAARSRGVEMRLHVVYGPSAVRDLLRRWGEEETVQGLWRGRHVPCLTPGCEPGHAPKTCHREREGAEVSFPLFPLREGRDRGHAATVQGSGA